MAETGSVFVALDIETTGLDPREHRICEFGAVKFSLEDGIIDTFSILVNPGRSIPFPAIKVHGIKLGMVEGAPTPKDGWDTLIEWAGESTTFVAHNASFECGFIQDLYSKEEEKPSFTIYDTLKLARRQLKNEDSYKLESLVPSLAGKGHRALPDAEACTALFIQIAETYKSGKVPVSNAKDFWAVDFFEENKPSYKQLSFIESLGGDPDLPKTKNEASAYIDELKENEKHEERQAYQQEKKGGSHYWLKVFLMVVIGVCALVIMSA